MTRQRRTILPTKKPLQGFWAASASCGYDAQQVWNAASDALATTFDLKPTEIRDFLDSNAGCTLANDLMFIEGGPRSSNAIADLIKARLTHEGWRRWFAQAIAEIRCKV